MEETITTIKISITSKSFFCALCYLSFPTLAPGNYWSVLCHRKLFVSTRVLYKYNHTVCTLWFISLCIIILRFIHFLTCANLFLSIVNRSYYMTVLQVAYPFMFQFLAIIHELLWTCMYKSLTYNLHSSNIQQFTYSIRILQ